jgi:cation transport ATPase
MKKLADARGLARRTAAIIRQNLTVAIGAMLVLVTGGLFFDLPLPMAVIGHEGGTVLVVLNGLRLLSDRIRRNTNEIASTRQTWSDRSASTLPSKTFSAKIS